MHIRWAISGLIFLTATISTLQPGLAQAGTNTHAGSMARGVHVYCPGNSPFKYCKPPAQNAPPTPKPAKNK